MVWTRPAPVTSPRPMTKLGDVAKRPAAVTDSRGQTRVSAADRQQAEKIWELKRRVAARVEQGEDAAQAFAAVKRELWPDDYREQGG